MTAMTAVRFELWQYNLYQYGSEAHEAFRAQGRCISRAPFTRFVMQQHAMTPSQLITATLDIRDKVEVLVAEMLETKNAQMELLELQELVTDLVENVSECTKNIDNLTKTVHELEKEVEDMRLVNDTLRLDASRDRHMFQYRVASLEALVQDMMARLPQDTTSVPGSCADTSPPEPEDATSAPDRAQTHRHLSLQSYHQIRITC